MEELNKKRQLIRGERPILLIAAHNFSHFREGVVKPPDLGSGDLVRNLCDILSCWGMVTTVNQLDPNWYKNSAFRQEIKDLLENNRFNCVIDVHGSCLTAKDLLVLSPNKAFAKRFSALISDDFVIRKFKNNRQLTLVEELDNLKIPAVQIEVREDGRVETIDNQKCRQVFKLLNNFLSKL